MKFFLANVELGSYSCNLYIIWTCSTNPIWYKILEVPSGWIFLSYAILYEICWMCLMPTCNFVMLGYGKWDFLCNFIGGPKDRILCWSAWKPSVHINNFRWSKSPWYLLLQWWFCSECSTRRCRECHWYKFIADCHFSFSILAGYDLSMILIVGLCFTISCVTLLIKIWTSWRHDWLIMWTFLSSSFVCVCVCVCVLWLEFHLFKILFVKICFKWTS